MPQSERAAADASAIAAREAGLHKDLGRAQLVMIGLGGAIGTGSV
jgi:L-asparagine transporter-like permease